MIARRRFVQGLALLAALPSLAQERRVPRIGYFRPGGSSETTLNLESFRKGMAGLQWMEGRDYTIDSRIANSVPEAGAGVAAALVASKPDVLLAAADGAVRQLAQQTRSIPIVFTLASDPVGLGFARSLQRPGGNITGTSTLARDLSAKRMQLLKEAFPWVRHVAVLFDTTDQSAGQVRELESAAPRFGLRVSRLEVRQLGEIEPALGKGVAAGAQAFLLVGGFLIGDRRAAIAEWLARARIPAMFRNTLDAEAGGLISYGISNEANFRSAASYVVRILKGAKPGDLPIEQPTRLELVVNLKTAKAMGLSIPQSVLLRADRVIE